MLVKEVINFNKDNVHTFERIIEKDSLINEELVLNEGVIDTTKKIFKKLDSKKLKSKLKNSGVAGIVALALSVSMASPSSAADFGTDEFYNNLQRTVEAVYDIKHNNGENVSDSTMRVVDNTLQELYNVIDSNDGSQNIPSNFDELYNFMETLASQWEEINWPGNNGQSSSNGESNSETGNNEISDNNSDRNNDSNNMSASQIYNTFLDEIENEISDDIYQRLRNYNTAISGTGLIHEVNWNVYSSEAEIINDMYNALEGDIESKRRLLTAISNIG